jgi:hypothetical protein
MVTHWSITEVRGIIFSEDSGGSFIVGHMPCSSEPRAIGPLSAKGMPTPDEAAGQFKEFPEQCSLADE